MAINKVIDVKVAEKEFPADVVEGQFQIVVSNEAGEQVFEYHADEADLIDDWSDGAFTIAIDFPAAGPYKVEAFRKDSAGAVLTSNDGTVAYAFAILTVDAPAIKKIVVPVAVSFQSPA